MIIPSGDERADARDENDLDAMADAWEEQERERADEDEEGTVDEPETGRAA